MKQKSQPNHRIYLETLWRMGPEERVAKAFELTEFARSLFRSGLRRRFPQASETELHALFLERLKKCHNRNY